MIIDYINAYCKAHKIATYTLKNKVYTLDDISGVKTYSPGIAFFYKLCASGVINNITDLTNSFLTASSTDNFIDFAKIAVIKDCNNVQQVESSYIFDCNNMITFDLKIGQNALFSQLFTMQLYYLILTPTSFINSEKKDAKQNDILKLNILS